jgi:O-antigen/teichoic acid export membrane protein
MLAVASGTGYMDYLTREAAKDERVGWGLWAQLIWLRLGCIVPVVAAGLGGLWLLGYPRPVIAAAAWLLLTLIPRSLSETVQGVLRGIGRYIESLVVELAFGIGLIAGAGLLVLRGGGVYRVIEAELIAAGVAALGGLVFALRFRAKDPLYLRFRQLLNTSAIFNVYAFVGNLYDRLDIVLLSKLAGNYATGVYSAAYRPIGTFQLLPYGVLYSLLPTMSRGGGAQVERERIEKVMGLLLSASLGIVLTTMVFANVAVPLFLGARFAESATALKMLIWAVIPRYLNYALNTRLLAGGHEKVFVATSLVCLVVNVIGNIVLIPIFSWKAAAVLTIVTEAALLAQNVYWVRRAGGFFPMPLGWARISTVFVALMLSMFAGERVASPLSIGSACLLFFVFYLYRSGMAGEFATAWRTEREILET